MKSRIKMKMMLVTISLLRWSKLEVVTRMLHAAVTNVKQSGTFPSDYINRLVVHIYRVKGEHQK